MPAKEKFGAQPPIELLRQWMDHKGWYDTSENSFQEILDIQLVSGKLFNDFSHGTSRGW
jgi:dynein heavy chain